MEFRLKTSWYLLIFRVSLVGLVIFATLISALDLIVTLVFCSAACLQLTALTYDRHSVRAIGIPDASDTDPQSCQQKIIAELHGNRRIECTLERYYCVWWLQILYLSSTRYTTVVLVLPDSCAADDRRRLRQILTHHGVSTVSRASGSRSG